ncbi:MAG: hypothetical protein ABUL55_01775 [Pseudomonadota bacterium]
MELAPENDLQRPRIVRHGEFNVVRDDLLEGGTKRRALVKLVPRVEADEVVYASHPYGHGQYALGLACAEFGKACTIFSATSSGRVDVFEKTRALPGVTMKLFDAECTQAQLADAASAYARERKAHFFPVGFDFPAFRAELTRVALDLRVSPSEVWALGGSGSLVRALVEAWPNAAINAVSMGFAHGNMGRAKVYVVPESPAEAALLPPPYPSAREYDAKIWQFVSVYGQPDALVWNVA